MSPRHRRLLAALLALAALNAVVYAAFTLPRTVQEERMAAERVQLQDEVARLSGEVADRRRYAQALEANAADTSRFHAQVVAPRAASLVPVLREIEGMAREGGLRPGPAGYKVEAVKGAALDRFVITMPVSGTYREVVSFIEQLERSPHFLTLDQVTVRGEAEGSESGGAQLDMVLSSYFRSSSQGS